MAHLAARWSQHDGRDVAVGLPELSGKVWARMERDTYLLYGFHPCTPLDFLTTESLIEHPNNYVFNAPDAQQFIKDITVVRLAAKDTLKLAQL